MAIAPYVAGPCLVRVNLRDGDGIQNLGYSLDGIEPQITPIYRDIYSDRSGGQESAPLLRQFLAATARIPIQLVDFEPVVLRKMMKMVVNDGAGGPGARLPGALPPPGCLTGQSTSSFQLILQGACDATALAADAPAGAGDTYVEDGAQVLSPMNFLNCFYEGPMTIPLGSKNTVVSFEVMALPTTSDTTASPAGDGKTRLYIARDATVFNNLTGVSHP
jgi:hypothetical protein